MAEMEREELEHWLEEVWKWWDQRETEPEQLELPFPPEQPKSLGTMLGAIAGVLHDVAE